ncbi:MAG: hypothetical protein K6B67_05450 [Lachnospiraceae bacterium]|nr:hypothetical protein [Lachnospiraceae bacterium]
MQEIIEQYGKAIMTVVAIILLIAIIAAVTQGSGDVFQNLISTFYDKAAGKANI